LILGLAVSKPFNFGAKRTTIKLWKAEVPLRAIMKQLSMSKATLVLSGRERLLSCELCSDYLFHAQVAH
jgi:hypothetical protein